jgi:hypothetical protein
VAWYAAHIVMSVKFRDGNQDSYPLWENIVLLEAPSDEEAKSKAVQQGRESEGDSNGSFRWNDRPATWVFAGVRKIIACEDPSDRPGDGIEITYSEMVVDSQEALEKLVKGEPVVVRYEE